MSMDCVSCGMPMEKPEEHALGDESKDYCVHCARPDGSMPSYEEALAGMTQFVVSTRGSDETAARNVAREMMAKLPAWRDRAGG